MVSVAAYPTLNITPNTPHWRRRMQVYAVLAQAPPEATYDRLIEYVRACTGKGCSRKLISKWKKERTLSQNSQFNSQNSNKPPTDTPNPSSLKQLPVRSEQLPINNDSLNTDFNPIQNPQSKTCTERSRSIQNQGGWLKRVAVVGAIAASLVGLSWILTPEDKTPKQAIAESPAVTQTVSPTVPPRRTQSLEPRSIKIDLTLTSPQDLKVKPGDEVKPGQILSDRTTERQRLLNQKRQLQISLKKLEIPIPVITSPQPIPAIRELPPVSYQQEEANISLKRQELAEAEQAIANQQAKIHQLQQLQSRGNPPVVAPIPTSKDNPKVVTPIPNPEVVQSKNPLPAIIEHEEAILKNLQAARDKAKLQLDIATSQLVTAKEQRAHDEYQRYLEQNKRAITLTQQQLELERQRSIRAGQLQEREYSKAQIEARIQEIDNAISNLSTVKAPYSGTVKKVKWQGQSDHHLTVELTLDVDGEGKRWTPTMFG